MAFSEMSGTVRPKTMLKASRSSTGARGKPRLWAKVSAELVAKREPVSAVYSATSPSVMVRGVAWAIACPTWKSSKKLPSLVFSLT
jgi:hypothetical protein